MKKIHFILLALALIVLVPSLGLAQINNPALPSLPGGADGAALPIPPAVQTNIWVLLAKALQWLFSIVIFLAAIFLVVAGFQYVTSNGDDKKVQTAFRTLIYALIGVAVAVLAKSLIYIVGHFLGTSLQF